MENDLFVLSIMWKALVDAFKDARVTEEILWMNGSTWAQLWSGVIGAVAGAGVAMHVLRKTLKEQATIASKNEQVQRELAETAAVAQAALATKQLTEQRQALERQLREQRDSLKIQLDDQRREASLNREHAAIAEVIAVITVAIRAASNKTGEEDPDIQARFAAVTGRWMLETQNPGLRHELERWPNLWSAAIAAKRRPHILGLTREEGREVLGDTIRMMLRLCNEWTHAGEDERRGLLASMAKVRKGTPSKPRLQNAGSKSDSLK
ncbi:hypothetical protein ACIPYV_02845 [Paenarthrobacter nicotinovorans]|uniref:hypothetical protein n=1 Tax=Paenarthrobacter nicotinovorans TaxID=29320 RepID=UPI0038022AFE